MEKTKPWYEDDSFWDTWGPIMFTDERMAAAVNDVDNISSLTGLAPGANVLALCCGPGRHSVELARRGFRVAGVDRTSAYLERARKRAAAECLDVELVQSDMREFVRPDSFDLAISMFTSFGYFEDPEDDVRVVKNICASLKPGGAFLIQTHGKETLARIFLERDWSEHDGVIHLYERKVSRNWSWMWNRWIMLRGNERIEQEISHRLYAGAEMAALLTSGGFSRADIFGGLDGGPYDHTARRLVAVGHR